MSIYKAAVINHIDEPLTIESREIKSGIEYIDLKFAALNHRDWWITKGMYPNIKLPTVLGSDGCGYYKGKRVVINPSINWGENPSFPSKKYNILGLEKEGTLAEKLYVEDKYIHEVPTHLTDQEAAALPLAGLTAYRVLFGRCNLQENQKVLITGIGGGVAQMAAKMAVAAGARVFVTSSSTEKIGKSLDMGVIAGFNYQDDNWSSTLKKKYGRVDVVIDGAGGKGFNQVISASNSGASIGIYGGTAGKMTDINPAHIFFKQLNIYGSTMGNDDEFQEMLAFISKYKIHPVVDSVYPLSKINDAMERLKSKELFGKVVIDVAQ